MARQDPYSGRKQRPPTGPRRRDLSENFAALIEAIRAEGAAERGEEQREDRGKKFREWVTIALIGATLIAVSWQVHEMIKVYEPVREQAEAAIKSAEAAAKSADAATKQAVNSERTLIQAQRAWVGPQNASFVAEPMMGKAIDIQIQYQNSGHEPATSFRYFAEPFLEELGEDGDKKYAARIENYMAQCRNNKDRQGGSVIYPTTGGLGGGTYTLNMKSNDDFVDEETAKGDKIIVVQGCFWYMTIDMPKHSYFCYFYKQGITKIQNLNICRSGHEAD